MISDNLEGNFVYLKVTLGTFRLKKNILSFCGGEDVLPDAVSVITIVSGGLLLWDFMECIWDI